MIVPASLSWLVSGLQPPPRGGSDAVKEDQILRWFLIAVFATGVCFVIILTIGQMAPFMNH